MTKPLLKREKDPRIQKLAGTHAILCYHKKDNEWQFFHVDNLPEKWLGWQPVKMVRAARSGFTISESIYQLNQELKNVKITRRQ